MIGILCRYLHRRHHKFLAYNSVQNPVNAQPRYYAIHMCRKCRHQHTFRSSKPENRSTDSTVYWKTADGSYGSEILNYNYRPEASN
jgi:hypothetical protein